MSLLLAVGHMHCSRNLKVHLRDMAVFKMQHQALFEKFIEGQFMGQRSRRSFSSIPLDQRHEQQNDWWRNESQTIEYLYNLRTVQSEQFTLPKIGSMISKLSEAIYLIQIDFRYVSHGHVVLALLSLCYFQHYENYTFIKQCMNDIY